MALSIGELVGYVDLDTGPGEKAAHGFTSMLDGLGGQWVKILGGAAATAGGVFAAGLGSAMSAEPATDKLAAELGSVNTEKWGEIAGNVYSNGFGTGLEDVNTAIANVVTSIKGMRSASDSEVQAMTERAMTFADVMGVDVGRAAQVAGTMINAGLAKNGGQAFDLLMKASQQVPAALREDVLDATEEYGQFFATIGMNGPQAMAALVEGSKKGTFGIDKMGDAVKEFSLLVATDMTRTKPVIKALGMDYGDTANAMLAGGDRAGKATGKIIDGLLKIKDPAKQARMAVELFGTPIEDLNAKDLPAFLKSLQGSEKGLGKWKGSVQKAGETAYDNAAGNLAVFGRGLKTNFVEMIGGSVLPKLTELTGSLTTGLGPAFDTARDAVKGASNFLGQHKTALEIVGGIIIAVLIPHLVALGVTSTITAAKSAAAWVVTQAGAVVAAVTHSVAVVGMVAGWVLLGAQSMLAAAKVAASWLIAMGPIGLVIALVVGLVVAVVKNWDTIKAATGKAWDWVSSKVSGAWAAVKGAVVSGAEAVKSKLTGAWDAIKSATSKAWEGIKGAVSKVLDVLKSIFLNFTGPGLIIKHWDTIKAATSKVWETIRGAVAGAIEGVKGAISGLSSIPGKVADWFGQAKQAVVDKFTQVVTFVKGIPGKITGALGNVGSLLTPAGNQIIESLMAPLRAGADKVQSLLKSVTDKIPDWKGPANRDKTLLRRNGQLIMQGLMDGIDDGTTGLKGLLQEITEDLGKKRLAKVEKAVQDQYARGVRVGKKLTKLGEEISDAQDNLADATKTRDDWAASLLPPSALDTARTALAEVTQLRDQMFSSVRDATVAYASLGNVQVGDGESLTGDAITAQLQAKLEAIRGFRANMAKLLAQGLDKASYQQMLADGVEKAGAMAEVLANDPAAVRTVADLSTQIQEAATGLASDGATSMHQAGVDTAQALVTSLTAEQTAIYDAAVLAAQSLLTGLESQEEALVAVAARIGERIRAEIEGALNVAVDGATGAGDGAGAKGKGNTKPGGKDKGGKDKGKDKSPGKGKNNRGGDTWIVNGAPGMDENMLAEKAWFKTRKRG